MQLPVWELSKELCQIEEGLIEVKKWVMMSS
jgi:hypothetical protein